MADNEATLLIRIKQAGSEVLDKISSNLDTLKTGMMAAATAVIGFGIASIKAYKESEHASNQLTQAMITQGIYTTELKKKYDEMSAALQQQSTYADEEISQAQATMQMQIGQVAITEKLMKATLDLAAAQGMDLSTAALMVGKTIGSSTNALARQGLKLNENTTESQKLALVTDFLSKKFGGQAEAAAQGLGILDKLRVTMSDFAEITGKELSPVIVTIATQINEFFKSIQSGAGSFTLVKKLTVEFAGALDALYSNIADFGENLGGFFGTLSGAMEQLLKGNFKNAYNVMKQGNEDLNRLHEENIKAYDEREKARQDSLLIQQEVASAKEVDNVRKSEANKAAVKLEADNQAFILEETKRQEHDALMNNVRTAELESIGGHNDAVIAAQMKVLDDQIKNETDSNVKRSLINARGILQRQLQEQVEAKQKEAFMKETLGNIASLQTSGNKNLAAIGKAAGIAQIAIDTPIAVAHAMASPIPFPGNMIAAGLVATAMAARAAQLAGIPLADGGIVKARPGGIQATIGEGGRDEAVIPLENGQIPGSNGGGSTIIFNGPVMGDESQAMEFARAIDRSLLKLRQSNQSVAFETDIF